MKPEIEIMQFFDFTHLPEHLREVSTPFYKLAWLLNDTLPPTHEKAVALRKLLESKDAAVRSRMMKG